METTFNIPSITCSVCSNRIKGELGAMDGIDGVNVDLKTQSLKVSYDPNMLEPADISRKIASMGFEVLK